MLKINNISKNYAGEPILENISFILNNGECIGIVGPNGCGKSTLLKIIKGQIDPDSGNVWVDPKDRIGYLPQSLLKSSNQETITDALAEIIGEVITFHVHLDELEQSGQHEQPQFSKIYSQFLELNGPKIIADFNESASNLGLNNIDFKRSLSTLSGGERTRLALAACLLTKPTILLLDEPTNNLDLSALTWLENHLLNTNCAILVVSHDRWFLDKLTQKIIEIDIFTRHSFEYTGNYSDYLIQKENRAKKQHQAHLQYEKDVKKLENSLHRGRDWEASAAKGNYTKDNDKNIANDQKERSTKSSANAKRLEKRIEKLEIIEDVAISKKMKKNLTTTREGHSLLNINNLTYPTNSPILENINLELNRTKRIAILGPNGSGKTTLLRLLTDELIDYSGNITHGNITIGYLPQDHIWENPDQSVLKWLSQYFNGNEVYLRKFLAHFKFIGSDVLKTIGTLSYGERAKLRLASIILQNPDLLILDEPTNHLDLESLEYIQTQLRNFTGGILIVSHDRYFLDQLDLNEFYFLSDKNLKKYNSLQDILANFH